MQIRIKHLKDNKRHSKITKQIETKKSNFNNKLILKTFLEKLLANQKVMLNYNELTSNKLKNMEANLKMFLLLRILHILKYNQ